MISRIAYRPGFLPVVAYVLRSAKDPEIVASSMSATTVHGLVDEFGAVAGRNTRCRNPVAHLVFSIREGEMLSTAKWAAVASATAERLGAQQWIAVRHRDTGCDHLHLIASRVKLTGTAWSTSNDRYRLREICGQFEEANGLTPTPQRSSAPRIGKTEIEKAARTCRQGKSQSPVPERLAIAAAVRAAVHSSNSIPDFERRLARQNIGVRWHHDDRGRPVGVSYGRGDACISGRNAGVSCRTLTLNFGDRGTNHHEQVCRVAIPGGNSGLAGALGPEGSRAAAPGAGGHDSFVAGTPGPVADAARGAFEHSGGPAKVDGLSQAIGSVGGILTAAVRTLVSALESQADESGRFVKNADRRFPSRRLITKHLMKGIAR